MKQKYHIIFTIISLFGVILISGCIELKTNSNVTDVYDFPTKLGTPEWQKFNSHDEMVKVTQIPESLLSKMSTRGLVETVLNYPLYGDWLAYYNLQKGFDNVVAQFNGLQELMKRKGAATVLLAKYRTMNPEVINRSWSLEKQGEYDSNFAYIEMLLAQDITLTKLTEAERCDLLTEAVKKIGSKQKYVDIYGYFGQERTIVLLGRILQQANYTPFTKKINQDEALESFLENAGFSEITSLSTESILNSTFLIKAINQSEGNGILINEAAALESISEETLLQTQQFLFTYCKS